MHKCIEMHRNAYCRIDSSQKSFCVKLKLSAETGHQRHPILECMVLLYCGCSWWVFCYSAKYALVGVLLFCMSQTWPNLWLNPFKQEQQTSNKSDREVCSSKLFNFSIYKSVENQILWMHNKMDIFLEVTIVNIL